MANIDVTVTRNIQIELDSPTLQALVDQLTILINRPAIGGTAVVQNLQGAFTRFTVELARPDA
jgi:hypothetical protein